jgi:hypothetical protein
VPSKQRQFQCAGSPEEDGTQTQFVSLHLSFGSQVVAGVGVGVGVGTVEPQEATKKFVQVW